jgi:hypothetical protein
MKNKYLKQLKTNFLIIITLMNFKEDLKMDFSEEKLVDELVGGMSKLVIDDVKDKTSKTNDITEPVDNKKSNVGKKKKERKIVYYAVGIDNSLFDCFKNVLSENPNLVKLDKIHSTLIFFKNHDPSLYEECINYYSKFVDVEVIIDIVGYGISENAFALDVSNIKSGDEEIKTYAVKQHITMALKKDIKAVESVKTLLGEGTVVKLKTPLQIKGFIKPYYW